MKSTNMKKSTVAEIKERFDNDVERFANLETGQVATIDASLSLELLTSAAKVIKPDAQNLLDLGCGAGNYSLKMLTKISNLNCTLIDLSLPMLERAYQGVSEVSSGETTILQGDVREIDLPENHFDIILAGAVLHHLRDDADWEFVFQKLYNSLKPGGCLMISDLITQEKPAVHDLMWERYGNYLQEHGGESYQQKVFEYIEIEDSPRPMTYQLDLMKKVGFSSTEILHKNSCFGAFGGIK